MRAAAHICVLAGLALFCTVSTWAANTIELENAKAGSPDWELINPAFNREIEGYASATSVNRGGSITFSVNTADPSFMLDIYRMGWYGGAGARRMLPPIQLGGLVQPLPSADPTTGFYECQWSPSYTLQVPLNTSDATDWASGVYLARLTGSISNRQSYIVFVVRDDSRPSDYLFQTSVTTYQAYNSWGGKSLYAYYSQGGAWAYKVSFNRPYAMGFNVTSARGMGAGDFLNTLQDKQFTHSGGAEYNLVRFLEREGYDVTYATDVDTHESPNLLLNHKGWLSVGHDEYWSWQMRSNVENARDKGINLAFFSANVGFWQIRFEPSPTTGSADRTIVGYKEQALNLDPYYLDSDPSNNYLVTTKFRNAPVNRPEQTMIGVMLGTTPGDLIDMIVSDATSWVYAYTGVQNGAHIPGIVGYEVDFRDTTYPYPVNQSIIAHSVMPDGSIQEASVYTAASNAKVVATGTINWAWGVDDYSVPISRPSVLSPITQQITRNVMSALAGGVPTPSYSLNMSPGIRSIAPGATATYTISTTAFGYTPNLSFFVTGLPSGATYSFSPATLGGTGSTTLTVTTLPSNAPGSYVLTITATDSNRTLTIASKLNLVNLIPRSAWAVKYVDSQETTCYNGAASNAIDGSAGTMWHTQFCTISPPTPHEIQLDLGTSYSINGFRYLPRQDGASNGNIAQYEIYISANGTTWNNAVASGAFQNDQTEKEVLFPPVSGRYVRLRAMKEVNGNPWTSAAEINLLGSPATGVVLSALTLNPTSVTGGSSSQGTVTLSGPAPTGGLVVNLSSSNTAVATVPASVTVAAGTSSATFAVSTSAVTSSTIVNISAAYGGTILTAALNVQSASTINVIPHSGWALKFVDSQETACFAGAAVNSFDGSSATIWHTQFCPTSPGLPHEIQIDLGTSYAINGFRYLPRQDGSQNGWIGQYEFYVSSDGVNWGAAVATAVFPKDSTQKQVLFSTVSGRYVRLRALSEVNNNPWTSMAELNVLGTTTSSQPVLSALTLNPTTVTGGSSSQGTVTLSGPAPTGGLIVSLSSSNTAVAAVPTSVTVAAGTSSATFAVSTSAVTSSTVVSISAAYGGTTLTAALNVQSSSTINVIPHSGWALKFVDSQETACYAGAAVNSFDGSSATIWHTQFCPTSPGLPHEIRIDLGASYAITGFRYLPRQDGSQNGWIGQYEFYVSSDGVNWGAAVATGVFPKDSTQKQVLFSTVSGRYVRLRALSEVNNNPWTSMAELNVLSTP